jgi:tRNA G10  N-methylase Trm11
MSIDKQIKNIEFEKVQEEWNKIIEAISSGCIERNGRNGTGNKIIDYYFFEERLKVKNKNGVSFYDFLNNIDDYGEKKYIQTLLNYVKEHNRYNDNYYGRMYYIYGIAFGRFSPFKVLNAVEMYMMFTPKTVFDPFMGWGGRLLGALACDVNYIGCDSNVDLKEPYEKLMKDFGEKSDSSVKLYFQDICSLDLSELEYDMVFTSPPYFNIEQYPHMPLKTRREWGFFYDKIFLKLYKHLAPNGVFAINCNLSIFNSSLIKLFGKPNTRIELNKSTRNQSYCEYIYVWFKQPRRVQFEE